MSEAHSESTEEGGIVELMQERSRMRVRLADVAVWVLGAALVADVGRRFWEAWKADTSGYVIASVFYPVSPELVFGAIVSTLAIVLGLRLAMQAVRAGQGRFVPMPGRATIAVAWRLVSVVMLTVLVVAEVEALRPAKPPFSNSHPLDLYSVNILLLVLGLLTGLRPPAPWRSGRSGSAMAAVLLAGVVGVTFSAGFMLLPLLVLVAIEGVRNVQLLRFFDGRPGLADRIRWSALPGFLTLASCLIVGIGLSRILRRGSTGELRIEGRERLTLAVSVPLMLGMAAILMNKTLPWLSESLMEGLSYKIGTMEILAVVMGFGGMSAGVVAGAVGRSDVESIRPRSVLATRLAWALLAVGLLALAVPTIIKENEWRGASGAPLLAKGWPVTGKWVEILAEIWGYAWFMDLDAPVALVAPALLWAIWRTIRLCGPWAPDRAGRLDAALAGSMGSGKVSVLILVLTILTLAAIPAFFLTGLAVYQFRLLGPNGP